MSDNPLVSILIPMYNSSAFLEETLNCAIHQTYQNIEIIVSDDCSTDNSIAIVKKITKRDPRIKLIVNEKNLGMCSNWNVLFALAKGEYWLKLDADDLIAPEFIEITLAASLKHNSDFTGTSYQFQDIHKKTTSEVFTHSNRKSGLLVNPVADIFIHYPFHLCFTLLKADFVKKISPEYFFMNTEVGDAEFQIRASLHPDFKAYFIAEKLGFYRFHGQNSSLTPLKQAKSFIYDVVGEHHYALKKALGWQYRGKLWTNFKHYLKSMILGRAPFDFKLLFTTLKYIVF